MRDLPIDLVTTKGHQMANCLPPITIQFMLACHTCSDIANYLGEEHFNSSAGKETMAWLRSEKLINQYNKSTEKGEAWVEFICQTPIPYPKWTLPPRETE